MASLGRRPLPENHYLNRGTAILISVRGPLPPIERLPGSPTEEELEEEGRYGEMCYRVKLRRAANESRDRIRLEQELGHKIAPRVLDSRWDLPSPEGPLVVPPLTVMTFAKPAPTEPAPPKPAPPKPPSGAA